MLCADKPDGTGSHLIAARDMAEDEAVLVFLLLDAAPLVLVLTLAVALWLTVVELRELKLHYLWWSWWILLVVMTHFVGYLILRGYALWYRRQAHA